MASNDQLIVGLDFGTTFTGAGFAYVNTPDDIEIIKSWPGGNNITSEKVPSEFTYDVAPLPRSGYALRSGPASTLTSSSARDQQTLKPIRWGYQVKPGEQRVKCIKLFLDQNQELPQFVKDLDVPLYLRTRGRTVVDAVADFLAKVHQHTKETLLLRYGQAFMRTTHVRYVITVPAMWTDIAKDATREAASRAGIKNDDIIMISEPEAAAVYTIKAIQPNHLKIGDNIIVCDAGGGTVDLISYKIAQLAPLGIEETQVGTGGLCGSAFLNFGFEKHVRVRIGEAAFLSMLSKNPAAWETALKHFEEYVKRNLTDESEDFNIPMPGIPDNANAGVSMGYLALSHEQVEEIFEPIVKQILDLIEDQVNAIHSSSGQVSAILLVGGFGQSMYLHSRVKSYFNRSNFPPSYTELIGMGDVPQTSRALTVHARPSNRIIEVLQPPNAWTAVTRGAIIRGLEGSITLVRMTRYHYGVTYYAPFDAATHSIDRRYWDSNEESYRARGCMEWYVTKGTPVSAQQAVSFPFYNCHSTSSVEGSGPINYSVALLATGRANPPDAYQDSFLKVCTITTDLRAIPREHYEKCYTASGKGYYKIKFQIEMILNSASLAFSIKVNGNTYGFTTTFYDH